MPDIAIIGGGIGGLTLARVLAVKGVRSTIYEVEDSRHARSQGGSLDLSEDEGQYALGVADLMDEFRAAVRPGGDAIKVLDRAANVVFEELADDDSGSHPEIDRIFLRDILIDSIDPSTIVWGKKATGVSVGGDRPAVRFGDGTTISADLVVGADGAWSVIRPALSPAVPEYCGVTSIELRLDDADRRHPALAELVGYGMMLAMEDGQGLLTQRNSDGSIRVYVNFLIEEEWIDGFADGGRPAIEAAILGRLEGWSPELLRLVTDADGDAFCRPLYGLPNDHAWERVPGITILGDAAHLMPPFGGHGANLAMFDGADLGLRVSEHGEDVEGALDEYESAMFVRTPPYAAESSGNLEVFHGADAPQRLAELFTAIRHMSAAERHQS